MYQPQFTITNKILKNIGSIEASKEVIDHAPLLPYYEKQFREDALVRTVHYGTHIEGNELNLTQAEKVLQGQEVTARDRDIQEVINYRKVMSYISDMEQETRDKRQVTSNVEQEIQDKKNTVEITEDVIKKIHTLTVSKILPDEKSGVYRTTSVVVKNSVTGDVSFRPPDAAAVLYQMRDFVVFVNNPESQDIHPVLKSGIVHYEFVRIHPFVDGNGRVGRALSTLLLFLEGYDIRKFFALEEYFDKDANRYYDALRSVEKNSGDVTQWLEYFTEGLAIELSKIKDKVEKISVDGKIREKLGGKPLMLTDRQLKIIEYVQKNGYLQNKGFDSIFPLVSEDTILNELRPLIEAGILQKVGVTKGARYVIG